MNDTDSFLWQLHAIQFCQQCVWQKQHEKSWFEFSFWNGEAVAASFKMACLTFLHFLFQLDGLKQKVKLTFRPRVWKRSGLKESCTSLRPSYPHFHHCGSPVCAGLYTVVTSLTSKHQMTHKGQRMAGAHVTFALTKCTCFFISFTLFWRKVADLLIFWHKWKQQGCCSFCGNDRLRNRDWCCAPVDKIPFFAGTKNCPAACRRWLQKYIS